MVNIKRDRRDLVMALQKLLYLCIHYWGMTEFAKNISWCISRDAGERTYQLYLNIFQVKMYQRSHLLQWITICDRIYQYSFHTRLFCIISTVSVTYCFQKQFPRIFKALSLLFSRSKPTGIASEWNTPNPSAKIVITMDLLPDMWNCWLCMRWKTGNVYPATDF